MLLPFDTVADRCRACGEDFVGGQRSWLAPAPALM